MTTTVTLPVELTKCTKTAAIQWQTSLKALVQEGLRVVLAYKEAI
jgi:hypothetical protein